MGPRGAGHFVGPDWRLGLSADARVREDRLGGCGRERGRRVVWGWRKCLITCYVRCARNRLDAYARKVGGSHGLQNLSCRLRLLRCFFHERHGSNYWIAVRDVRTCRIHQGGAAIGKETNCEDMKRGCNQLVVTNVCVANQGPNGSIPLILPCHKPYLGERMMIMMAAPPARRPYSTSACVAVRERPCPSLVARASWPGGPEPPDPPTSQLEA
jgi:hypothetical protein